MIIHRATSNLEFQQHKVLYAFLFIFLISYPFQLRSATLSDNSTIEKSTIEKSKKLKSNLGAEIRFVDLLINDSLAANKITSSGNVAAQQLRYEAKNHLNAAKQENAADNVETARKRILKAKQAMFRAIKLAGNSTILDKHQSDFNKRYESVRALIAAHKRIREEKHDAGAEETELHVQSSLSDASKQFKNGDINEALELINNAYLSVKLSLTKLRHGDTMVRSLNFENKGEEYQYELKRNDTHNMLVEILLKEKLSKQQLAPLIMKNVQVASELREKAEQHAKSGEYERAIALMEKSTKQIVFAIRAAGIYIPG